MRKNSHNSLVKNRLGGTVPKMKTEVLKINPQALDLDKIRKAAQVIKAGGIVAFPTETVYGLAADFFNQQAVNRIFAVKKRPRNKALPVQIQDIAYLKELAVEIPPFAYKLMSRFWPGPLTLIFSAHPDIKGWVSAQGASRTIGVRIPNNNVAQSLIKESHRPLVAPSANFSGEAAAQCAEELLRSFDGLIEMVIDAGKVELGRPSTVVDFSVSPYRILRQGAISQEDICSVPS